MCRNDAELAYLGALVVISGECVDGTEIWFGVLGRL